MPLARQEQEFACYGLNFSTKTMANWIIQYAEWYLQPLYGLMKAEFLQGRYAHGDVARVQVIDEPDTIRGAQASATVYSITETALMNGLKPYNYLPHVMEKCKISVRFRQRKRWWVFPHGSPNCRMITYLLALEKVASGLLHCSEKALLLFR